MAPNLSLTLWSSPISDASARVRISLALKNITYTLHSLSLSKQETQSTKFTKLNLAQTVPTLMVLSSDKNPTELKPELVLSQSNAILEYLEEVFPDSTALLPPLDQPEARARVRALVGVIGTDIHPLKVHRVAREIYERYPGSDTEAARLDRNYQWNNHWARRGLHVYESLTSQSAGLYSVGDTITLADVYLMPEIWTATRMGMELSEFPLISRIYENLSKVPEIQREKHRPELEEL